MSLIDKTTCNVKQTKRICRKENYTDIDREFITKVNMVMELIQQASKKKYTPPI